MKTSDPFYLSAQAPSGSHWAPKTAGSSGSPWQGSSGFRKWTPPVSIPWGLPVWWSHSSRRTAVRICIRGLRSTMTQCGILSAEPGIIQSSIGWHKPYPGVPSREKITWGFWVISPPKCIKEPSKIKQEPPTRAAWQDSGATNALAMIVRPIFLVVGNYFLTIFYMVTAAELELQQLQTKS